jgi:hypothetical protein
LKHWTPGRKDVIKGWLDTCNKLLSENEFRDLDRTDGRFGSKYKPKTSRPKVPTSIRVIENGNTSLELLPHTNDLSNVSKLSISEDSLNQSPLQISARPALLDHIGHVSKESGIEMVKDLLKGDNYIVLEKFSLSLRCPLGLKKIVNSVRPRSCNHIQTFDLKTFMMLNINSPNPKCPVCNARTNLSELVIDDYTMEILQHTDKEIMRVELFSDGSWKIEDETKKRKISEIVEVESFEYRHYSFKKKIKREIIDLT